MTRPETRACWYQPHKGPRKGKWTAGLFHQWGTEPACCEGDGCYSVAIIEDNQTHAIVTIMPDQVHFGSDPTSTP